MAFLSVILILDIKNNVSSNSFITLFNTFLGWLIFTSENECEKKIFVSSCNKITLFFLFNEIIIYIKNSHIIKDKKNKT